MVVNGIDTKDISVVVQGAVDAVNTPKCLASVRKHLPGAEIILSTWEGTNVEALDFDKVLLNKDPGGIIDARTSFVNNLNRQIVSSFNGLKEAKNKYAIKIRSDIIFRKHAFLKYFYQFPQRQPEYSIFEERLLFCSYFFKRYLGSLNYMCHPTPYHLSDWFVFGLTKDVLKLFSIPLTKEPAFTQYRCSCHRKYMGTDMFGASHQYAPEQYILHECVKMNTDNVPPFTSIMNYTSENIEYSNRIVANNCIILNPRRMDIYCGKNGVDPYRVWSKNEYTLPFYIWEGLYRYDIFLKEYRKYCDGNYQIPFDVKFEKAKYLAMHKLFEVTRAK